MKKFIAVFCLLLCAATLQAKDKPNPADFNIKIHISSTQLAPNPYVLSDPSLPILIADTILNGKKVRLAGDLLLPHGMHMIKAPFLILSPGDYQVRLKEDNSEKDGSIIRQAYELLLPNGDIWECSIIGISE
jgi:hypothetical protein